MLFIGNTSGIFSSVKWLREYTVLADGTMEDVEDKTDLDDDSKVLCLLSFSYKNANQLWRDKAALVLFSLKFSSTSVSDLVCPPPEILKL